MTSENETYLVRPLPRKKRYAWGSNWKQIHLPLAYEMLHHQEKRTIEFEGNRYSLNTHSESGDLFDLSIELLTTPNIRRQEAHKFQMKRSQSFYHPKNKDKFNFQEIHEDGAVLTEGRGRVSGNFRGTKIIYKRYKPDTERERSLRRKEIEDDLKCALNCIDLPEFMIRDVEYIVNESQPVDIELTCRRFRVSDIFASSTSTCVCPPYLVFGPLPYRNHVVKFYTTEQQSKQVKLVRNQFERTVDYDADCLTPEEAMLIANAADWMTASNCKTFFSTPCSAENHIQAYLDKKFRTHHIDIKNENEAKDVSALET